MQGYLRMRSWWLRGAAVASDELICRLIDRGAGFCKSLKAKDAWQTRTEGRHGRNTPRQTASGTVWEFTLHKDINISLYGL